MRICLLPVSVILLSSGIISIGLGESVAAQTAPPPPRPIPPSSQPVKQNQIGPTVTFGNGSSTIGVNGKYQLSENVFEVKNTVSLRPFVRFANEGTDFGAAVTYDFDFPRYAQVTPYAGLGLASLNGTRNVTTLGLLGAQTVTQNVNDTAFYGQVGVDINTSPDVSVSGSLQVPFNNKFGTNFSLGASYRF
jgi:Outer membrane protein beta-barrel domain